MFPAQRISCYELQPKKCFLLYAFLMYNRKYLYLCSVEKEKDISQMYTAEIVAMLGRRFKDYRIGCDMTQKEVSEQSGISVVTIRNFENGRMYNITLGTFVELLRAVGFMQGLDEVLPEIPISPYELEKIQQGKRKRVRHAK